jgi:DNA-binding NtrC family response regulator
MVYLAEPETPMDVGCLPVQIRNPAPAHRADPSEISGNELKLTAVVGRVERTAIREALRRSQGNKSRAARLLGLSRNGLAQKMARHGLGSGE